MTTPPPAAFDHLIHWVGDLDAAMSSYDSAGLATHAALTMPGFRNAAWGIDDERYVELATVDDWDAAMTSDYARGLEILRPAIDALGGDSTACSEGAATYGVNVPDIDATIERLRAAGHEVIVDEVRFDEKDAGFTEVHVADSPAHVPFFIAYDPPREVIATMRADHRAARGEQLAPDRPDIAALVVGSSTPKQDARHLGELLQIPSDGGTVALPGAAVRFTTDTPTGRGGSTSRSGLFGIEVTGLGHSAPFDIHGITVFPVERRN